MESENKLTNLSQSEIAIKDFNTFASLVNAKPDAKTKFFYKNVRITKDSIIDLSERVFRKLSNAEDKNIFCKIYINFEDGNKLEYSSWDSFINKKITLTSALKSITLIWDFFVTLKNYNLPQRHRLMVKITDELKPEEYLHLVFTKKIEDLDEVDDIPNIVSSVEFVDHILADELLYIVEEWVKSVTCVEDNRLYKLVYDNKRKIAYIVNYIPILFLIIYMYNLTISHFSQYGNIKLSELTVANLQSIYSMIFVGIATCLIAYKLSYFVARKIYNMIASKRELHIFEITKGDNDSIQLINDSKKKGVKNILLNILFQLAISIVSGLVMNLFS